MNISLVIPTRNRAARLQKCLLSLVGQIKKGDEILVVDNNSQDETRKIVLRFKENLPVKYLFEPRIGPSFARNTGIKHARKEILGFLDDDNVVAKSWVEEAKRVSSGKNLVFLGRTRHVFAKRNSLSEVFLYRQKVFREGLRITQKIKGLPVVNFLNSGNFSIKRKDAFRLKYFFDQKTFPFIGEQQDLAERLQLTGFHIVLQKKMIVEHLKNIRTWQESLSDMFFWGMAMAKLQKKYQTPNNVRKLFKEQIKPDHKNMPWAIKKSYSWKILALYVIEEMVYILGKLYGRVRINP